MAIFELINIEMSKVRCLKRDIQRHSRWLPDNSKGHSAADLAPRHLRNYCKRIFEFGSVIVNLKALTFRVVDSLLSSFEVLSLASHQGYAFPAPVCLL